MREFTQCAWNWRFEGNGERIIVFPYVDKDSPVATICHRGSREDIGNAILIAEAPAMYYALTNIAYELECGSGANPDYVKKIVADIKNTLHKINHSENYKSAQEYAMCELLKQCLPFIEPLTLIDHAVNRHGQEIHYEISPAELTDRIKKILRDYNGTRDES